MRFSIFFCAIYIATVLVSAEDILSEDDEIIIRDEKQFKDLWDCLMDNSPCADQYVKFKDHVPDYLKTNCENCSAKEKELFIRNRDIAKDLYPQMLSDLSAKYAK